MDSGKKTLKISNSKTDLIMNSLHKFYNNKSNITQLLPIINGETKLSLRIIDWFVTNYAKKNNTIFYNSRQKGGKAKPKEYSKIAYEEYNEPFIVFLKYKSQLNGFQKKLFDPFCRRSRIQFHYDKDKDKYIITTVGQLNFFKWAIENNVLHYIKDNIKEIESDMNKNIRKLSPSTKKNKKSRKNKDSKEKIVKVDITKISEKKSPSSNQSKRRKRRELSSSATKTLNKHNFNIVLDFD